MDNQVKKAKVFKICPVVLPESFDDTLLHGMRCFKYRSKDFLVMWVNNNILFADLENLEGNDWKFDVLTIPNSVSDVMQLESDICCLDSHGFFYRLEESVTESSERMNISDTEDMFLSLSENGNSNAEHALCFKEIKQFAHTILAIHPIPNGLILVKTCFGKLFVEGYKTQECLETIEMTFSVELCREFEFVEMMTCTITSSAVSEFDPLLISQLLRDIVLLNVQVVFIALGKGPVYYLPVMLQENIACMKPKLLYRALYSVAAIHCLPETNSSCKLITNIVIVMIPGPLMVVSYDTKRKSLCYEMTFLPSDVMTLCSFGGKVFVSNCKDLWHCSLIRNEIEELSVQARTVGVNGAYLLHRMYNEDAVIVATVHGTFYKVITDLISNMESSNDIAERHPSASIAEPLTSLLQRLSEVKQQLIHEDELLTALNITLRSECLKNSFTVNVSVYEVCDICFDQEMFSVISDNFGLCKEEINVRNYYLLKFEVLTVCELEFLPSIWSVNVSLALDNGISVNKCAKLETAFKKGSPVNVTMFVNICNPVEGVCVNCTLISELPDDDKCNIGPPWLVIPIITTELDVTYFIRPTFTPDRYITDTANVYERLLPLAQENHRSILHTSATVDTRRSHLNDQKVLQVHCYTINVPDEVKIHEVWSEFFRNCLHRCSQDVRDWFQKDSNSKPKAQEVHLIIGTDQGTIFFKDKVVTVSAKNVAVLHAVKTSFILSISRVLARLTDNVILVDKCVSRVLELQDMIEIEKTTGNIHDMKAVKTEWRNFVTGSIPL